MVVTAHHIASPKSEMLASGLRRSASSTWNARCVTRQVDPPVKVDGWRPVGELRVWLRAEDGWWVLSPARTVCDGYARRISARPSPRGAGASRLVLLTGAAEPRKVDCDHPRPRGCSAWRQFPSGRTGRSRRQTPP